jgi:hypothetical protein
MWKQKWREPSGVGRAHYEDERLLLLAVDFNVTMRRKESLENKNDQRAR